MKVKHESGKAGLKLNIQKTKIMAFGHITSWQIHGAKLERVADFIFIFLGSKVTADSDSSHEIKRCLLHGRKVMTNLDRILQSRDIALPTKFCLLKAMFFPCGHVWVYQGFPDCSVGKESTCNAGDPSLILGLGRSTGEGIGYPLLTYLFFQTCCVHKLN